MHGVVPRLSWGVARRSSPRPVPGQERDPGQQRNCDALRAGRDQPGDAAGAARCRHGRQPSAGGGGPLCERSLCGPPRSRRPRSSAGLGRNACRSARSGGSARSGTGGGSGAAGFGARPGHQGLDVIQGAADTCCGSRLRLQLDSGVFAAKRLPWFSLYLVAGSFYQGRRACGALLLNPQRGNQSQRGCASWGGIRARPGTQPRWPRTPASHPRLPSPGHLGGLCWRDGDEHQNQAEPDHH